ncbi:MAG: FKBP-type peptidyl-prolyl cis-trans isomerase [Mucilaginibacter sp.]|uniref:FKBP-type peptidyl-prolyl cis-trans isomerase n=1 Tax=Mucilaginibacter sp. TaxID=1882438 RepID=UPI0031B21F50
MKKLLLLLFAPLLILSACSKKDATPVDPAKQAAADETAIKAYIAADTSIHATRDPSGLYYQILKQGTGAHPKATSNVTVNYTGKLLNGSVFQTSSINNTPLQGLIPGWIIGIPYTNVGGRILLIIPSGLGYGPYPPDSTIPPNSVLVFTIDLIGFQ